MERQCKFSLRISPCQRTCLCVYTQLDRFVKRANKHHPPYEPNLKLLKIGSSPAKSVGSPLRPPLGVLAQDYGGSCGAPPVDGSFCFRFAREVGPLKLPVQPAASGSLVVRSFRAFSPPTLITSSGALQANARRQVVSWRYLLGIMENV